MKFISGMGTSTTKITNNSVLDISPQINNLGEVVWEQYDGNDYEIYYWRNGTATRITNNAVNDYAPRINDRSEIVWYGSDGTDYEIFIAQKDSDADGVPDFRDNCPTVCNVHQLDADGDGKGDVCDTTPGCGGCGQPQCEQVCPPPTTSTTTIPDTDSDGILDNVDNCPNICNTQQLDADGDLIGDVCDDPNNDGCGSCGQPLCETPC